MEEKGLVRLGILILFATVAYFVKRERDKKQRKIDEIISKHSVQSKKTTIKIVSSELKNKRVNDLKRLVQLLLNEEKANQIIEVINKRIENNDYKENWTIIDELLSRELQNYNWQNDIYLYGYFDWKQPSTDLNHFVKNSLKHNFGIEKSFKSIFDFDENKFIHDAFPLFEEELHKHNLSLKNIDIGGDCYTIIIFEKEKTHEIEGLVDALGFILMSVSP